MVLAFTYIIRGGGTHYSSQCCHGLRVFSRTPSKMVLVLGKVMQSEMQTYLFDVLKLDHERYSQHKDHQPAFFTNVLAGFVEAPLGSVDDSCS